MAAATMASTITLTTNEAAPVTKVVTPLIVPLQCGDDQLLAV